jgi:hypothetical protein
LPIIPMPSMPVLDENWQPPPFPQRRNAERGFHGKITFILFFLK